MIRSQLCDILGIEKPIFQGGMAWIADANLAAAVSNAGGLGLISSINAGTEAVREEIRKARTLTRKPFGVNIMLAAPNAAEIANLVVEEGVTIVTTGAGSPAPYMERWLAAGIRVIPVVASVAYALKMEELGATAVIAEGAESGGHVGDTHTMALVPQVVDAVHIPVLAAGGIADGRGAAAARLHAGRLRRTSGHPLPGGPRMPRASHLQGAPHQGFGRKHPGHGEKPRRCRTQPQNAFHQAICQDGGQPSSCRRNPRLWHGFSQKGRL